MRGWLGAAAAAAAAAVAWRQDRLRLLRKSTTFRIPNAGTKRVDVLAAKPSGLSSVPGTHKAEGKKRLLRVVLRPPTTTK